MFFWKTSKRPRPPPLPRPFLEITLRFFPENPLSMRKFAMKFFGLAMTPPLSPPFWKLHCAFFLSKIYRFETNKICNVIFRNFSKKTSIFAPTVVPYYHHHILIITIFLSLYTPLWAPPIILSPRKCRNLLPGQGVYLGPATPSKQDDDDDNGDDNEDDDDDDYGDDNGGCGGTK